MILGDKEYIAVHIWIKKNLGKADECWMDVEHKSPAYELANVSREYKYEISDWIMLCKSCHAVFDKRKWTLEQLRNYVDGKKVLLGDIVNGSIDFSDYYANREKAKTSQSKKKNTIAYDDISNAKYVDARPMDYSPHDITETRKQYAESLENGDMNFFKKRQLITENIPLKETSPLPIESFMEMAKTEGLTYSRTYLHDGTEVQLRAYHE